jgi:hypothetical protein
MYRKIALCKKKQGGAKKTQWYFLRKYITIEEIKKEFVFLCFLLLILSELAFISPTFLRLLDVKPPCRTCRAIRGPAYFLSPM